MTSPRSTSGQLEQAAEGKIRKLKRRFPEVEEKHQESRTETLSGERNVRMREEPENSSAIIQESKVRHSHSNGFPVVGSTSSVIPMAQSSSAALPSNLLNSEEHNLREAMTEDRADGGEQPLLASSHLGPQISRREEGTRRGPGDVKDGDMQGVESIMANSPEQRNQNPFPVPNSNLNQHSQTPASQGHHPSSHSKPLLHQPHMQPRSSLIDNDVIMSDATVFGNNDATMFGNSDITSNDSSMGPEISQKGQGNDLYGTGPSVPSLSARAKGAEAAPPRRSSRQNKGHSDPVSRTTRSGSSAIAAAAVIRGQGSPGTTSNLDAQQDIPITNRITVATSSNFPPKGSKNSNPPTKSASVVNPAPFASHSQVPSLENTPSMENIIKVAAAAVAAQNAAAAVATSSNLTQSHQAVDPNLDPNLSSTQGSTSSKSLPAVDTKATSSGSNSAPNSATASNTATPNSSLSNNPYLGLSMLAKQGSGSTTPAGHPTMPMHPHSIYYPPNTPITPNTPTYPVYGNPYYYLAGPMAGPNGMLLPPSAVLSPPTAQRPPAEPPRTVKPKRLKAHTVTTKSFSIPMVPRDKGGKPMLPLNVGIMTVINLGEVCMREHFHTERYIFPVGYEVTRRYLSTIDPAIEVVYHCTILDGGDGPKFQIIPSDRADKPIIAGTATGAWSNIVKQANAIRNRQHSNSVSGPDFFGLGQNTIKHLIQELPNSDRLRDYVWQNFVEGGPLGGRHAAVIPALPEEYDASMPIGAYYPKREVSANPGVPRGLSHYPQHIIAQAEAQKSQQLATQQANGNAGAVPSSSSSSQQHEGSTFTQSSTQGNHLQIGLAPASSSKGLNIQHYQPIQQAQTPSQGQKRATKNSNTSTSATSGRSTRASTRGSQRQEQQQQVSVLAPDASMPPASEAMPTTFAGIMSQFRLTETPHSASG